MVRDGMGKASLVITVVPLPFQFRYLQLKTGWLDTGYFRKKFGVDVWNEFRPVYEGLEEKDLLKRQNGNVSLTRRGLLEVDHFLIDFFEPELRTVRYA